MKYVMHVAGMPFDGNSIAKGQSLGGSESAGYYVAKTLAAKGHEVFLFCNLPDNKPSKVDGVNYMPIGQQTEKAPLGLNFMHYASNVPHDVLLIQREPHAFRHKFNSKVNLWWCHDLALKRSAGMFSAQSWNIDNVLTVSEYHKKQLSEIYNAPLDKINILPNGIEPMLFKPNKEEKLNKKYMVYSSRPERGLENLVKDGGIMEQLLEKDPSITLKVCGYDNTTKEMAWYYNMLWERCNALPNVENLGPLSKGDLARLMSDAWLHIYPTDFEETSCITAMEEQTAGTPFLTTMIGALPETLYNGGAQFVEHKDGKVNIEGFVKAVLDLSNDQEKWEYLHNKAINKSKDYYWSKSVYKLEKVVSDIFQSKCSNKDRLIKHYFNNSDIFAAIDLINKHDSLESYKEYINVEYGDILEGKSRELYETVAANEFDKGNKHNIGNHLVHLKENRNKPVLNFLSTLEPGSTVLDYGCCVGHQTFAYASQFKDLKFIGVDVSEENIKVGLEYKNSNSIDNVDLFQADKPSDLDIDLSNVSAVLCTEVIEHVPDFKGFIDSIEALVKDGTKFVITTPYGPYEAQRWDNESIKEHLHHFEEEDLKEAFGSKDNFGLLFIANGVTKKQENLGHFCTRWHVKHDKKVEPINYDRKHNRQSPKETVAICMISNAGSYTIGKTLQSLKGAADEIHIGFDYSKCSSKSGVETAKEFGANTFEIESPTIQGFDSARNEVIAKAKSDWILWIDSDEFWVWPEKLSKFMRNNLVDGYAVAQHHFSCEPAGLIKTDIPCRLFRNNGKYKFFGVVHEHPGKTDNEHIEPVFIIPQNEAAVSHNGYDSEDTRRKRFERNIGLMKRDREKYPDRILGKTLWIRDLCHLNSYEFEATGSLSQQSMLRAQEAIDLFNELVEGKHVRNAIDSVIYLNQSVDTLTGGKGIEIALGFGVSSIGIGDDLKNPPDPKYAKFLSKEDAQKFIDMVTASKFDMLDSKYL